MRKYSTLVLCESSSRPSESSSRPSMFGYRGWQILKGPLTTNTDTQYHTGVYTHTEDYIPWRTRRTSAAPKDTFMVSGGSPGGGGRAWSAIWGSILCVPQGGGRRNTDFRVVCHRPAPRSKTDAPKSRPGHEFILVLMDYATRYPEAIPLLTTIAWEVLCCSAGSRSLPTRDHASYPR